MKARKHHNNGLGICEVAHADISIHKQSLLGNFANTVLAVSLK